MLTLDDVARWVTRYFWRKTDRIVARAGLTLGTDATVLQNYVESTWTPAITPAAGSFTTLTYTTQVGKYTRIGNVVFYHGRIVINAFTIGTGSGTMYLSLPLAVANDTQSQGLGSMSLQGVDLHAAVASLAFAPQAGQSYGVVVESADNAVWVVTAVSALAAGDDLNYAGFYFV